MATADSIAVMMKLGVILRAISSWSRGSSRIMRRNARGERFDGLIHIVRANQSNKATCAPSKPRAKGLDRNVSSEMKRQFTVHLYRNWRVSSKALAK